MSYAENTRTMVLDMLATLDRLAQRAQKAGMDDSVLAAKLADDMYPLETQFRIGVNQVILALGRVCGSDMAMDEEPYGDFSTVREAIAKVRGAVEELSDADWIDGESEVDYTLPNGMRFVLSAAQYCRDWMLPNLYFHTSMAYALLRREGLDLGKGEFIGHMARYARAPAG